jgi:surface antigen
MRNATRMSWRLRVLLGVSALPMVLGTGCQSTNNTEGGLLAGGGLGAVVGALAAGPRHALAGALIGGAAGATVGGLAGASADKSEQRAANAAAARDAALRNPPLGLEDIARLTASGTSDDVIIAQIYNTGSVYYLGAEHIVWLQNNGVHEPVIRAMQATVNQPRMVAGQPVYVVQPPPPVGVGVGMTFVGGRRW